jgi:hypothetical protein
MDYYDTFLQEQRARRQREVDQFDQETRLIGTSSPTEEDCEHGEGIDLRRITTPIDENTPF